MNMMYKYSLLILLSLLSVFCANAFEPIYSFQTPNLYFFINIQNQVLIRNAENYKEVVLFDPNRTENIEESFIPINIDFTENKEVTIYKENFYYLDDKKQLNIYNTSNPNDPTLLQIIDDVNQLPNVTDDWVLISQDSSFNLYQRNQDGTLTFFNEIDSSGLGFNLTAYDANTFIGVSYANLPTWISISPDGQIESKWIPLGFHPFQIPTCAVFINEINPDRNGFAVSTSYGCADGLVPPDFVPDQVEVPVTWDYSSGTGGIVFVNSPELENPIINMPVIGTEGEDWPESVDNLAIYNDLYFTVQSNSGFNIWKRVINDLTLVFNDSNIRFVDLAIVDHWLITSKSDFSILPRRDFVEVYDIRTLQTQIADWEMH